MMRIEKENGKLIAYPEGRIDSNNAAEFQNALDTAIRENEGHVLEIDAGNLTYISSAGLRVLQSVRKKQENGLTVRNVTPEIYEILDMTGFTTLLTVRKKLREFSVEGCPVIGRGAIGTVYRLDADTIVKVYEIPDCLPMIENEQRRAKQAFLKGIPTAISYDVVKVGEKYGSVFEMLKATTYNDVMIEHPERREETVRCYAEFIRSLHAVEMDPGELPQARDVFLNYLEKLKDILPGGMYRQLREMLCAMPENLHVIHGDIQMKNVMLSGDEPLLIDMDTLSVGDPVFDLMSLYVTYVQFGEDEPDNSVKFLGLPADASLAVWKDFLRFYFDGLAVSDLELAEKKIKVVALVRFLYLVAGLNIGDPGLKQVRIRHALQHLEELLPQIDSLSVGSL